MQFAWPRGGHSRDADVPPTRADDAPAQHCKRSLWLADLAQSKAYTQMIVLCWPFEFAQARRNTYARSRSPRIGKMCKQPSRFACPPRLMSLAKKLNSENKQVPKFGTKMGPQIKNLKRLQVSLIFGMQSCARVVTKSCSQNWHRFWFQKA